MPQCAYCQRFVATVEVEHVFPDSWYPDDTAPTLTRPKVSACSPCNRGYGQIEARLQRSWALCLDPRAPASKGIPQRVWRSLDGNRAHGPRDAFFRDKARKKIVNSSIVVQADEPGSFPGLNTQHPAWRQGQSGLWVKGVRGLLHPASDVARFTEKLVRGLHAFETEGPIPPDAVVSTYIAQSASWPSWFAFIERYKIECRGVPPGFLYWYRVAPDDRRGSLWFFQIWGRIFVQAATLPEDARAGLVAASL